MPDYELNSSGFRLNADTPVITDLSNNNSLINSNIGGRSMGISGDYTTDSRFSMGNISEIPTTSPPTDPSLVNKMMTNMGLIDDKGQFLGLNKNTLSGLGTAFSAGKGLFDIYNANRNFSLAKDYYGQQMGLQREQAQAARDERARIANARESLVKSYMGRS